jgi:hypothetical protein
VPCSQEWLRGQLSPLLDHHLQTILDNQASLPAAAAGGGSFAGSNGMSGANKASRQQQAAMDWGAVGLAHVNAMTGACFALGLRFAGEQPGVDFRVGSARAGRVLPARSYVSNTLVTQNVRNRCIWSLVQYSRTHGDHACVTTLSSLQSWTARSGPPAEQAGASPCLTLCGFHCYESCISVLPAAPPSRQRQAHAARRQSTSCEVSCWPC